MSSDSILCVYVSNNAARAAQVLNNSLFFLWVKKRRKRRVNGQRRLSVMMPRKKILAQKLLATKMVTLPRMISKIMCKLLPLCTTTAKKMQQHREMNPLCPLPSTTHQPRKRSKNQTRLLLRVVQRTLLLRRLTMLTTLSQASHLPPQRSKG